MKRKRLQTPHDRFFKAMFGKTAEFPVSLDGSPVSPGLFWLETPLMAPRGELNKVQKKLFSMPVCRLKGSHIFKNNQRKNNGEINM